MTVYTHTIQVSEATFQRLQQQAATKQKSINAFADEMLNQTLLPTLDHVPEKWRTDLQQLQTMSDGTLWRIAKTEMPEDKIALYDDLLQANSHHLLSPTEQEQLTLLREEADLLMIRRSYALLLLKWRGHTIPDPYSLTTYE